MPDTDTAKWTAGQVAFQALNAAWALVRLVIAVFVTVMSKPQPAWLDVKRLVRR